MSKVSEQTYKKIATYVIFPIVFLLTIYYGYQIIDVVLISYTKGEIRITNQDASDKYITLSSCHIEKTKTSDDKMIFASDDKLYGLILKTSGHQIYSYHRIIAGVELLPSQCSVITSDLMRKQLISSEGWWRFRNV